MTKQLRKLFWFFGGAKLLSILLRMVKADEGFWPTEECMNIAHGAQSAWAPELVITRLTPRGIEILLAEYRKETGGVKEFWGMWHIPGGYDRVSSSSIADDCTRLGLRELGVDVRYIETYQHPYKWMRGEHPYGRPLSLYVRCEPLEPIQETPTLRWFNQDTLPVNVVPAHERFIFDEIFAEVETRQLTA